MKTLIRDYGWYLVKRTASSQDKVFDVEEQRWKRLDSYTEYTYYLIVEWCYSEVCPTGRITDDYWDYAPDRYDDTVSDKYFEVIRKIEDVPSNLERKISKQEHDAIQLNTCED